MPGRDGTGPRGQGPRTGRGLGRCISSKTNSNMSSNGRGYGRRHRWHGGNRRFREE